MQPVEEGGGMTGLIPITVPVLVSNNNEALAISIGNSAESIPMGIGCSYSAGEYDNYEGPYEVTPGPETQVLETNGKVMINNVTVKPIPQNYGLVTWNGSVLTIS